jgi:potassium channel subfamily K, other eukaryote
MLQTMYFITYLLLGALVFSKVEDWEFVVAVYWADVTVLTVGLGDYSPQTDVGRGLLFPFALGGVLTVGLVVGSIRSLVLERGREKMSARIVEKRRGEAIHNVDARKQTIKISWFAAADFSTDPALSPAQRREEEFKVMRKVQEAAETQRRYMGLLMSTTFAVSLWLVGAAIFMVTERTQQWTYFDSVYFTFVCLLTIGYGGMFDYYSLNETRD